MRYVISALIRVAILTLGQVNRAIDSIIHEQHITVILAAHRLSSIARAERVVVIEEGKVSEEGRYDVLVSLAFLCGELKLTSPVKTRR